MLTTITTTEQLLSLRDAAGVIRIDGDCRIECDVPWTEAGEHIAGIDCRGYLSCRGYLYCGGYLSCRGDLYCRGYLSCGGNCAVHGDWYWSHASRPQVAGRLWHRRVLPSSWQRAHWQERLGFEAGDGACYGQIIASLDMPRLLRRRCWSSTERWILESLGRADAAPPEWVVEMSANAKEAP